MNYLHNTKGFMVVFTPFMKKHLGGKVFLVLFRKSLRGKSKSTQNTPPLPIPSCDASWVLP